MQSSAIESFRRVYARPHGVELDVHITRPVGAAACPAILDIHGGAWTYFDHQVDFYWCRELARRGYVVASANFRQAPRFPWPVFLADLRAAARWLRAHADELGIDPGQIGAMGGSTGGHLSTMLGIWPQERSHPSTAALAVADDADAHVDFVVALWPILDVPGRYQMVSRTRFDPISAGIARLLIREPAANQTQPAEEDPSRRLRAIDGLRQRRPWLGDVAGNLAQSVTWIGGNVPPLKAVLYDRLRRAHEGAFASLSEMQDASPLHRTHAGLAQRTPPMLIVQGDSDTNLTVEMTQSFASAYRQIGGNRVTNHM